MKYYAVKKGRNIGIYQSWEECKAEVEGFSGAIYKSFSSLEEAEAYLNGEKKDTSKYDCIAYVDGSYDHSILAYGSGVVILYDNKKFTASKMGNDTSIASMRNVAGEIVASMMAMQFAYEKGCKSLLICYDYEGIEKWCTGVWQTKKDGTARYRQFYLDKARHLNISFKKIKSHSNDKYNDEADELAKKALGIL